MKLPLRTDRTNKTPDQFDTKKINKLVKKKQTGVLECEAAQLPGPVQGTPPYTLCGEVGSLTSLDSRWDGGRKRRRDCEVSVRVEESRS